MSKNTKENMLAKWKVKESWTGKYPHSAIGSRQCYVAGRVSIQQSALTQPKKEKKKDQVDRQSQVLHCPP